MEPESETPLRREDERPSFDERPTERRGASRRESLRADKLAAQAAATARLKRRLNWAIAGLVVAIISVYLILFFVG